MLCDWERRSLLQPSHTLDLNDGSVDGDCVWLVLRYHTGVVSEQRTVAATRDQTGGHVPLVEHVKLDKLVAADHFKVIIPIAVPLQFIGEMRMSERACNMERWRYLMDLRGWLDPSLKTY